MIDLTFDDYGRQTVLPRKGSDLHVWLREGPRSDVPVVMFIHGAGVDHRMWARQITPFAEAFRLVTLDVRGHGRSRPFGDFSFDTLVDDAFAVLDALKIDKVILVGLSMGGNIAQEMVYRQPDRVLALICLDCTCNTLVPWIDRITVPFYTATFDLMLALYPFKSLVKAIARSSALTAQGRAYLADAMSQATKPELGRIMATLLAALHNQPAYTIPVPQLLLQGDKDRLGNIRKVMPQWHARDAGSTFVIVPEASHLANIDNAAFVNAAILTWLTRTFS